MAETSENYSVVWRRVGEKYGDPVNLGCFDFRPQHVLEMLWSCFSNTVNCHSCQSLGSIMGSIVGGTVPCFYQSVEELDPFGLQLLRSREKTTFYLPS